MDPTTSQQPDPSPDGAGAHASPAPVRRGRLRRRPPNWRGDDPASGDSIHSGGEMTPRPGAILSLLLLLAPPGSCALAQTGPKILSGVGIDQNLGAQVPADATFRDESG